MRSRMTALGDFLSPDINEAYIKLVENVYGRWIGIACRFSTNTPLCYMLNDNAESCDPSEIKGLEFDTREEAHMHFTLLGFEVRD